MIKLVDLIKEVEEARLAGDWHNDKPPKLGHLYHNTTFEGMLGILKSNFVLKTGGNGTLSFSRAKKFLKEKDVRIIVDGKKLAQKYDVQPYNWGGDTSEWEEQIVGTNKADISDCVIKVLLKPGETGSEEKLNQFVSYYEVEHQKALKNWPKQKAHLIKIGYDPEKYWKDESHYLSQTPEEYRAELKTLPEFQEKKPLLPEITKELKEKSIPYEITDNFPAAS